MVLSFLINDENFKQEKLIHDLCNGMKFRTIILPGPGLLKVADKINRSLYVSDKDDRIRQQIHWRQNYNWS